MTRYKLEDIFDLQMGKTPSRNNSEYWSTCDNKWISIGDLTQAGKYITDTKEYLSDIAVEESGIKIIPANTVVMSFKLSIGKTAITSEDMYSNEAIMAFHDKHVVDLMPEYIYYMFKYKDWDEGTNKAVMGKTLNKATLSKVEIEVCSLEKQKEIVELLDKVSTVLDGRNEELKKLDEIVKARFVELFGDSENNNKHWLVYKLDELCDVGSSKRIYQEEQTSEGIPFWRISDLVNKMDVGYANSGLFISQEKYDELKEKEQVPVAGDILVTSRGTLGRCYIISKTDKFYFQDGMISWLSKYKHGITPLYIKHLFMTSGLIRQINGMQAGSTVAYLSITMLKKLDIMLPDPDVQLQFEEFVKQVDKSKVVL